MCEQTQCVDAPTRHLAARTVRRRAEAALERAQGAHLLAEVEQEGGPAAERQRRQDSHHLGRSLRRRQAAVRVPLWCVADAVRVFDPSRQSLNPHSGASLGTQQLLIIDLYHRVTQDVPASPHPESSIIPWTQLHMPQKHNPLRANSWCTLECHNQGKFLTCLTLPWRIQGHLCIRSMSFSADIFLLRTRSADAGRGLAQPDVLCDVLHRQAHFRVQAGGGAATQVLRRAPRRGQRRQVGPRRCAAHSLRPRSHRP